MQNFNEVVTMNVNSFKYNSIFSILTFVSNGGMDGTRTRDPLRDRQVF